jgi:hypothetical protein
MLPIGFAAVLGLVLGRYFKVPVLAFGGVATTAFAVVVEWSRGADAPSTLAAVAMAAACLQLTYLVGSATAASLARSRSFSSPKSVEAEATVDR